MGLFAAGADLTGWIFVGIVVAAVLAFVFMDGASQ